MFVFQNTGAAQNMNFGVTISLITYIKKNNIIPFTMIRLN